VSDPAVVVGEDGLARCGWAVSDALMRDYHDREWGVQVHGERALFERIALESFQSGLSWRTILAKRPAFRAAFADFDPEAVAAFGEDDVARLLGDAAIVRNRAKIEATIANARAILALRDDGGLDRLIWSHRPEPGPAPTTLDDLEPVTPASTALVADLRRRGFRFVGPTTAQSVIEAIGLIDPHLAGCHRRGAGRQTEEAIGGGRG
jgi:DNA-3-methyladenine glycosylase I